jgi:hypothetical protein
LAESFERFDRLLLERRSIEDRADTGPDLRDDETELAEDEEAAEGERRFGGRGGIGGWCVGSDEMRVPTEELRRRRCSDELFSDAITCRSVKRDFHLTSHSQPGRLPGTPENRFQNPGFFPSAGRMLSIEGERGSPDSLASMSCPACLICPFDFVLLRERVRPEGKGGGGICSLDFE